MAVGSGPPLGPLAFASEEQAQELRAIVDAARQHFGLGTEAAKDALGHLFNAPTRLAVHHAGVTIELGLDKRQ